MKLDTGESLAPCSLLTERDEVVRIIHSCEVTAWERFDYEENLD